MDTPKRILIVRTSSLGDIVRDVVALPALRRAFPDAAIDWILHTPFVDAIRHHPALTEAIPFDRALLSFGNAPALFRFLRELRGRRYDLAIDLQGLFKSALLTAATRAPRRVGFADARELAPLAYTQRVRVPPSATHHVDRRLALLHALNLSPAPDAADLALYPGPDADRALAPDLAGKRYLLISPATRGLGRAWPIDRFADLVRRLLHRTDLHLDAIVVVGLPSERDYCAPILNAPRDPRLIDRIGATTIPSLMALVRHAALVLCNDSAVMHLAVAFDRPLVALLGPTRLETSGPYQRPHDAIIHRDPHERVRHRDARAAAAFMQRITVDEVERACAARLAR